MTTAQVSRIAPPPSVAAVLSALTEESRIGQVDFTSRLAPEPEAEETAAPVAAVEPLAAVEEELEDHAVEDLEDDLEDDDHDLDHDTVEPVALQAVPELEPEPEPEPAPVRKTKARSGTKKAAAKPAAHTQPKTRTRRPTPAAEPTTSMEDPVAAPLSERIHEPGAVSFAVDDDLDEGEVTLVLPELDERPPSVEEIARLVVERMHDAELAMMRHLEAIEAEAARRAELLTAQAELDAELIRLNARREAHHILTQARQRARQDATPSQEQRQVEELTDSLTRFADVVDELRPAAPRPTRGRTP